MTADGFDPAAPRNALGIRPETSADFVRRVQPLLTNKCANAACHGGAAGGGLQLAAVRTGLRHQRTQSEHNLATVLGFIDAQRPDESPLLRALANPDSGAHRHLFFGPRGNEQFELLRNWVRKAAAETSAAIVPPATAATAAESSTALSPPLAAAPWPGAGPAAETAAQSPAAGMPVSAASPGSPRNQKEQRGVTDDFLRGILKAERPDAFDPDEFNRLVHGVSLRPEAIPGAARPPDPTSPRR
jgi:hypothetical protein